MDNKSCQSSGDSTITSSNTNHNSDHYLKNLNKLSHKISKPIIPRKPPTSFDHGQSFNNAHTTSNANQPQPQPAQHQPPVYNINKSDFRDVVQKLTGSPSHDRYSAPPPIHPPKPQSSRLQRIRPPPLAHVTNRPPPLLNSAPILNQQPSLSQPLNAPMSHLHMSMPRPPSAPLSPLPPFPSVHPAAESPVSAYMRYLQNSMSASTALSGGVDSNNKQFSGFSPLAPLVSPRWNNLAPPPSQQQQPFAPPPQMMMPQFQLPTSPSPFGCLNSPKSPHPFFSPGSLLSPSAFPLSPTLPVASPRWRSL
ncbi:VQ motif-containing protein 9 [Mercurialis annua]|uniref:VQ motif-containing protein 9 n=1 Tax=Mercurialis annua TaxID=3986 RepID=UPI00215E13DC|nr:VQ motif-containing protein 9 [Mercurialis annua]